MQQKQANLVLYSINLARGTRFNMKLPDYKRVIYQKKPLIEVVCQLRFPTILKIGNQDPVEFQEEIRFEYPLFEATKSIGIPAELFRLIQQIGSPLNSQDPVYNFRTENLKWQLSLNKDFIAISTTDYEKYEDFRAKFKKAVEIFEKIYNPSFYSRVGLKYRDLIVRSNLNLLDKDWTDLIQPWIVDELHNPQFSGSVKTIMKNLLIATDDGYVQFNHGLVMAQDPESKLQELAYLLDTDLFVEGKIKQDNVWNTLDKFKQTAGQFFRWCITEKLHEAMEPRPIKANDD